MRTLLIALLTVGLASAQDEPVTSFETEADQPFTAGGVALTRVEEHATDGRYALRVDVPGAEKDTWPGFYLKPSAPDCSRRELLAMDIFLAGNQPELLSVRVDDLNGKSAFNSMRLNPGLNKAIGPNLKAVAAEVDLTRLKQLLLYIRIPHHDLTFYVDNVRWTTFQARFVPVAHLDPAEPVRPSADEQRRGFVLYRRPTLDLVFADSSPDRRLDRLGLFAALGEREPVTLHVHALKPLEAVDIVVSDLRGPAVLPAGAWDLRVVEYLHKRFHYKSEDYLMDTPAYLAPLRPVSIESGRSRSYHLTVTVPPNAAPGLYQGTVTVRAGQTAQEVPLSLRVLPFALPESGGLFYGEYYGAKGRYNDTPDKVRADLADMRRQGMTTVGLCTGIENTCFKVDGEQVTFDFQGRTWFEWFMEAYRELGFPAPVVLLSDSGQAAAGAAGKLGEPRHSAVYVAFHRALAEECRRRGWPIIYVQPVDEPGWQSQSDRDRNVALLKLLDEAGIPTEQDGPGDDYFHFQAGPYAKMWNYNGAIGKPDMVAKALAEGRLLTIYNNDVESYRPEVDRWAYGLFAWRHGLVGGFNWEYRGGYGDLYDNLDHDTGDWVHNYPAEKGRPGGPSLAWEASREGVDDRRYLLLLEQLIDRARRAPKARAAADAAAARLADLRERLSAMAEVRSRAAWGGTISAADAAAQGRRLPEGAARAVIGSLKQPNNIAFDEYDTIRWLVALEALRLREALGEGTLPPLNATVSASAERLSNLTRGSGSRIAAPRPMVKVPVLATLPRLDGVVESDPAWSAAAQVSLTRSNGSGAPEMPTEVRFGLRDDRLLVAFICHEDRLGQMTASVRENDGPVWEDDCVEIFLVPGVTQKSFYQVVINSLGTIARIGSGGKSWKPAVQAATRIDADGKRWLVEASIPVGDLKLAPRFGLNFARERRPLEVLELSTWSVTGGGFAVPERFGVGVIEGNVPNAPPVEPKLALQVSPQFVRVGEGTTRVQVDLALPADKLAGAGLTLAVAGAKGFETRLPAPLAERMTADLSLADLPPGDYELQATLAAEGLDPLVRTARLTILPSPLP